MPGRILLKSQFDDLNLLKRGKVRDIYAIDGQLLILATDRISAFDVVMDDPIPDKGKVLTGLSLFWMGRMSSIVPNHIVAADPADYPEECRAFADQLEGRSMLVKKAEVFPVECVARGYLSGSGWKDYQKTGTVCGIRLPAGLQMADKLPEPIYTPSTKADVGEHDENVDFDYTCKLVGEELATRVRDVSLKLYTEAAEYALKRGIIIADTKFEFGVDDKGTLTLIDEALTPDSSRFWPADQYTPGISPPSFDKQYVRDYLETLDWNKKAPGPKLPQEIREKTAEKYQEALRRLTS